jgi:aminoglycoside 2'-N-acetyltransferase I
MVARPERASVRIDIRPGDAAWEVAGPLLHAVWPPETVATLPWGHLATAHADRRVLVTQDRELVSHIGLFIRACDWGDCSVRIGGIGGVATSARHRGRGFASAGMKRAIDVLRRDHDADFGMLFCEDHNIAFYRGLGWQPFSGTVFADQPTGRIQHTVVAPMVYAMRLWPRGGLIDLRGLPW